ncbi:MAG: 4-(cytidine 5'-diphospho)-2-C-methyl-D-erythritol kinase [Chloroflexota bacterium]|nr:4-(cytidine 5'-diphospho)-2-C-methyl-D-erythritol kinase [Chloroflexota bacterium]
MQLKSPAKINLGLEVLRKRTDSFHDLSSIMLAIDLCDEVRVRPVDDPENSEQHDEFSHSGLTEQALNAYCSSVRVKTKPNASVKKTIPIAAGLGGGSSNAAVVLSAANHLSGRALSDSELADVASHVGSDVPFFLSGGCALVAGRGDIRKRDLPIPKVWIVLANPGVELSTPDVFRELDISEFTSGARTRVLAASLATEKPRWDHLHNGLQAAAERLCPQIRETLAALRAHTPWTLLSGSGATCFGIFEGEESSLAAEKDLTLAGYWTWAGRPMGRWTIADLRI